MDGGLSAKRSGLEGIEIDQLDVGPVGSSPRGQPGRAGAHHVAEGDGGIDEGEGGGVDSDAQFAAVVGQDDNVDGYAGTWEQVEEDGRLHGLLGQVGLLDEASVSLRIGRSSVTTGREGSRADGHIQDSAIGQLVGSTGTFGRTADGGQSDREAHLDEGRTRSGSAGRQRAHFDGHSPNLSGLTPIVAQVGKGEEVSPSKRTHRCSRRYPLSMGGYQGGRQHGAHYFVWPRFADGDARRRTDRLPAVHFIFSRFATFRNDEQQESPIAAAPTCTATHQYNDNEMFSYCICDCSDVSRFIFVLFSSMCFHTICRSLPSTKLHVFRLPSSPSSTCQFKYQEAICSR